MRGRNEGGGKDRKWDTSSEKDGKRRGKELVMLSEMGGRNSQRKDLQKSRTGGMCLKEKSGDHVERETEPVLSRRWKKMQKQKGVQTKWLIGSGKLCQEKKGEGG